jgi:hypothetical protein
MVAHEEVDESFLTQVRTWVNEVLEIEEVPSSPPPPPPPYLSVSIWTSIREKRKNSVLSREKKQTFWPPMMHGGVIQVSIFVKKD